MPRLAPAGAVLALSVGLWGCATVGPDFKPPPPPAVAAYAGKGDANPTIPVLTAETRTAGPWWKALGSPALDGVMTQALSRNQTVAAAVATLDKARAEAQRESGALLPKVMGDASFQRERINTSVFGFANFPSPTISLFNIGPTVSYDLDIVGGGRRRVEAARAAAEGEAHRADAAYLTLTGNVAMQAAIIANVRAQLDIIDTVAADDRRAIDILRASAAAGGGAPSASLGGELQLAQDLALAPPLKQRLAQARHALALLVGESPGAWTAPDFAMADFTVPTAIPVYVPSILVRQRPDIQASESALHKDTALVGVATARLYPDIRLVAGIGQEGVTPGSLFGFGANAYNFGPSVTVPLFDGGALRADRRAAQAQARIDLANYQQTVIAAFVQVSDVLSALAQDRDRLESLDAAETTARRSLAAARSAYDLGGAPLASVVTADRQWRRAALARSEALGQKLADVILLYGATAADWRWPDPSPPKISLEDKGRAFAHLGL